MDQTRTAKLQAQAHGGGTGLSGNALKMIAIFAMLTDHVAAIFLPAEWPVTVVMRAVGRITAPIMFYFIAEGYRRTRNVNRYTLRLAVFALISYIPYIYAFYGALPNAQNYYCFNVIYTLLLGLLAIRARNEVQNPALKWGLVAVLLALSATSDWYYMGVVYILLFDYYAGDFKKQAFAYCLATLVYILPGLLAPVSALFGAYEVDFSYYAQGFFRLGMFVPIVLLGRYGGQKGAGGRAAKWGFYIFYPAHLLVLGLLSNVSGNL